MKPNGHLIQLACERSGLSVPHLAYRLQVQPSYLYTIVNGKRRAGEQLKGKLVAEDLITLDEAFGAAA